MSTPESMNRVPRVRISPGSQFIQPERLTLPRGEPRSLIPQLREQIPAGITVHEVIGAVLDADARRIFGLISSGGSVSEPLDQEIVQLYGLPNSGQGKLSDMLPKSFAMGFLLAAGDYSIVADTSRRIENISLEPVSFGAVEATMDPFERKRREFAKEFARNPHLGELIPQELVEELEIDQSGATWFRKKVEDAFGYSESVLAGAKSAARGVRKLYDAFAASQ